MDDLNRTKNIKTGESSLAGKRLSGNKTPVSRKPAEAGKKKQWRLNGRLILPLTLMYEEFLLRAASGLWEGTFAALVVNLAVGLFLNLLLLFIPEKHRFKIAAMMVSIDAFLFGLQYFINNSYQVFMSISDILVGTKGVVTAFGGVIIDIIANGIFLIILFLLPLALMIIFRKRIYFPGKLKFWKIPALVVATAIFLIVAMLLQTSTSSLKERYTDAYTFNDAVRSFGLSKAIWLDLKYAVVGVPESLPVVVEAKAFAGGGSGAGPSFYGRNEMDVNLDELIASSSGDLKAVHEYVKSRTPSNRNAYTGLFEGKNLIFITAETFAKEVIDEHRTPTLWRLATKGIVFEDYYQPAWGGSTSTGEYANIFGIVPTAGVKSILNTIGQDNSTTIGNKLRELGYFSRAYHNGYRTYYDRHKTHLGLGYDDYIAKGNGLEKGLSGVWPESDLEMMEFTLSQYIDSQPFSVYYMTISGHCNYGPGSNMMAKKNMQALDSFEGSVFVKGFLACNMEFEYAMEYLVTELEKAGIADDTVIVISTDHYPYGLESSSAWGTDKDYLSELYGYTYSNVKERDHSALIIWCGCLEDDEPPVIDTPTYSLDILPTLCNLFGVEYDSRLLVGRDVFSGEQPLVMWTNGTWLTEKGFYNSSNGKFTPAPDAGEVPESYIDAVKQTVRGLISFSKKVLELDYYKYFK